MPENCPLVLASASPRRRELLATLVETFEVVPADIDETPGEGESPEDYVRRMAHEKARRVADTRDAWVLGSDTSVVVDGRALGKPADADAARSMLASLSGRGHEVLSAVALVRGDTLHSALSRTRVCFAELPVAWIEAVIASGEPMDKAGAYAIQGRAAMWVEHLSGSYTGVVGLPLYETAGLLRRAGLLANDDY